VTAYLLELHMDHLLTPRELSAVIALAERTIYNRRAAGGDLPPAIILGRRVRFKAADVYHWLERHREDQGEHTGSLTPEGDCA
jgi:predicted DNA-binding transcriptional regulator AlpA